MSLHLVAVLYRASVHIHTNVHPLTHVRKTKRFLPPGVLYTELHPAVPRAPHRPHIYHAPRLCRDQRRQLYGVYSWSPLHDLQLLHAVATTHTAGILLLLLPLPTRHLRGAHQPGMCKQLPRIRASLPSLSKVLVRVALVPLSAISYTDEGNVILSPRNMVIFICCDIIYYTVIHNMCRKTLL